MVITAFYGQVIQTYGSVDLMVNNAGIVHETEWRRCVDINLVSLFKTSVSCIFQEMFMSFFFTRNGETRNDKHVDI